MLNLTYTKHGDYLYPNLVLPTEKEIEIGIWGMRHKAFLKANRRAFYNIKMADGTLFTYLAEIDRQADELFLRLAKEMAFQEGVTEELKTTNQMLWVKKMNAISESAREIVNTELIFV